MEEKTEFEKCKDPITGLKYFVTNHFYINHPVNGKTLFKPYPFQEKMLDTYLNNNKVLSLNARQNGASTCAAAFLLWYAMFNDYKSIVITSPKEVNKKEILDKIRFGWNECPEEFKNKMEITQNSSINITFSNGSHITIEPPNTIPSLVFADNFAFESDGDKLYSNLIELAEKSIISSSVNTNKDMFVKLWKMSEYKMNSYVRFKSRWDDNPNLDYEWKRNTYALIGKDQFDKEYNCIFPSPVANERDLNEISEHLTITKSYFDSLPMRKIVMENRFNFDTNLVEQFIRLHDGTDVHELSLHDNIIDPKDYSIEDICKIYNCTLSLIKHNMPVLTQEEQAFLIDPKQWIDNNANKELDRMQELLHFTSKNSKYFAPPLCEDYKVK